MPNYRQSFKSLYALIGMHYEIPISTATWPGIFVKINFSLHATVLVNSCVAYFHTRLQLDKHWTQYQTLDSIAGLRYLANGSTWQLTSGEADHREWYASAIHNQPAARRPKTMFEPTAWYFEWRPTNDQSLQPCCGSFYEHSSLAWIDLGYGCDSDNQTNWDFVQHSQSQFSMLLDMNFTM